MTNIPQTGFYFDGEGNKHDYYLDGKRMTGVTTILGVLAKPALIPWAARMAVEYIKENAEVFDHDTYPLYQVKPNTLEEAKTVYAKKRDEGATKGTSTHSEVERYIRFCIQENGGTPVLESPHFVQCGLSDFIKWAIKENIKFLASEKQMYSKELFVAGTADFIFEKDGKTYIGDIKTYKKIWDRTPFYQCAGYALMWEEMHGTEHKCVPTISGQLCTDFPKSQIHGYCIFNLPKERPYDEAQDVLWSFDVEGDTKAFLACVEIYRQNAQFKPYNSYKK